MSKMTDPHNALLSFQQAFMDGEISPQAGSIHRDISVYRDEIAGEVRLTYALIDESGIVKATVVYVPAEPHAGKICFTLGYAVAEPYRNRGIATDVLRKSIDEIRAGLTTHIGAFYIEAVVGKFNLPSNRVAAKVISSAPQEGIDRFSGEPALQYFMLVD